MRSNFDKNISRLEFQAADMLNESNEKVAFAEQSKILTEARELSDAIYTSSGAHAYNKRMKALEQDRVFSYKDKFITKALTEALSVCANKALLLNEEEYGKLNPNYKTEIRETIQNFLENAKVNPSKISKDLLTIYEEIVKEVPPADLYLTEEDEEKIISDHIMSKSSVDNCLDNLCRDVRARVANIVTKDQQALSAEQDTLDFVNNKELEVAPMVPVQPEPAPEEDAPLQDPESQPDDNTAPADNQPDDTQQPMMESFTIRKRSKKHGIVETLAINEANQMLSEGQEYNKTLALANTIKFITILETLDASGAVEIGPSGYNNILAASGAEIKLPTAKLNGDKLEDVVEPKFGEGALSDIKTPAENKISSNISNIVNKSFDSNLVMSSNNNIFKPDVQIPVKIKTNNPALDVVNNAIDLKGKYTNMKGEVFTEEALREFFENQGFDLNYVDFDNLTYTWHFKKH